MTALTADLPRTALADRANVAACVCRDFVLWQRLWGRPAECPHTQGWATARYPIVAYDPAAERAAREMDKVQQ